MPEALLLLATQHGSNIAARMAHDVHEAGFRQAGCEQPGAAKRLDRLHRDPIGAPVAGCGGSGASVVQPTRPNALCSNERVAYARTASGDGVALRESGPLAADAIGEHVGQ